MTMNRMFLRGIVVGFFLCLTGSLAFGASSRTFVASNGTNNATCGRTTPCDTFAHALAATSAGGEIDVLDSADYGPVTIAQSVSIVAEGVVAGIQATSGGDAIDVTGSSVTVVLRGLTLDGLNTGNDGISFTGSGALHVEDCTINQFSGGIEVRASSANNTPEVLVTDTILRNNGAGIFLVATGGATIQGALDNVRMERNETGVFAQDGATVSVRNSVAAFNFSGFAAASVNGGPVVINVESSLASDNDSGINPEGAKATINISNVTVVDNTTGLSATNGGHIVSFGNNKVTDNTTNGSPTKTIAQK
jgi:hypothetical protein